jgi:sarcosine oxidase subunit gamma
MSVVSIELAELSDVPMLGLKGSGAAVWLAGQGIEVPPAIYDTARLGSYGYVLRLGTNEFMLQDDANGTTVSRLQASLQSLPPGVYLVPHEDAVFELSGSDARLVFAQTCGIDFRTMPTRRVLYSRVAGVSCGILPEEAAGGVRYRIWLDPSYADYLWETLVTIVTELGGRCRGSAARTIAVHHI